MVKQGSLDVGNHGRINRYYPLSTNLIPMWLMLAWPVEQLRDAMAWTSLNGLLIAGWGALVINEILRRSKVQLQYRILAMYWCSAISAYLNMQMLCEPDLQSPP